MIGEFIKITNNVLLKPKVNVNSNVDLNMNIGVYPYKANVIVSNSEYVKIEGNIKPREFEIKTTFPDENFTIKMFGQTSNVEEATVVGSAIIDAIKNKSINSAANQLFPKIYDQSGNEISSYEMLYDGEGLKRYSYIKINLRGKNLFVYEVGFGSKGIYTCVLDESGQTIGIVSKGMYIKNGKKTFTIYALNSENFKYTVLATIGTMINFEEDGVDIDAGLNYEKACLNTFQPELKAKFNASFIEQIKQQSKPEDLPENMPLVKEYKKKAQNTFGILSNKIHLIIFFIIIVAVLIYSFTKK